jgi:hypothetical protein
MQEKFSDLTDYLSHEIGFEWEVIKQIVDNQRKIKHEKRIYF